VANDHATNAKDLRRTVDAVHTTCTSADFSKMVHIRTEDLERYYLGLVADAEELASLEEHLLWCHQCLDRAESAEGYVDLMRIALLRTND
jgi:hypothetical protein